MRLKESQTSKYYGVRQDARKTTIWYRATIYYMNRYIYLGNWYSEEMAAHAFNIAFKMFQNGNYIIENSVKLSECDKLYVENRVQELIQRKIKSDEKQT